MFTPPQLPPLPLPLDPFPPVKAHVWPVERTVAKNDVSHLREYENWRGCHSHLESERGEHRAST